MAALDISCHSVDRITALFKESGGTRWVDLTFRNIRRESFVITLFLADHDDPRFAALAEFISATWPETPDQYTNYLDKVVAETPEAAPTHKPEVPF